MEIMSQKKGGSQKRMINNEKNKQSATLKRISILIKIILFLWYEKSKLFIINTAK